MKLIPTRSKKSRPAKAADIITTALKIKAAWEVAQTATKGTRKAARKAGKKAAKRAPVTKRVPVVLAGAGGAALAVKKLRGGKPEVPASTAPPQGAAPGAKVPA